MRTLPLIIEQSNYATKIVNAYIACELDKWSKAPRTCFMPLV